MNSRTILIAGTQREVTDLRTALLRDGFEVISATAPAETLDCVTHANGALALVMVDMRLPRRDGIEVLRDLRRVCPSVPVIAFSGASSPDQEADAVSNGATAFLPGPFSHETLIEAIRNAILNHSPAAPVSRGRNGDLAFSEAIDPSNTVMRSIERNLRQIALSDVPIIVRGETGVGKEVIARRIVALSGRASKPFLKMNCAAVPSELLESELFGYERGAFTGAFKSTPGRFEAANGGTLMLDEIGDMEFKLQSKLLHVLQDNEFQRVGGRDMIRVNVRVIAATHCNLEKAIQDGSFRQDLYYRLNVVSLFVPPLRERQDEILPLAEHFLRKYSVPASTVPRITPELRQALLSHPWPGNVRELENAMRRLVVFAEPDLIVRFLQSGVQQDGAGSGSVGTGLSEPAAGPPMCARPLGGRMRLPNMSDLETASQAAEAEAILKALEMSHWNRRRAAALLELRYKALLYKMKKLGISSETASGPDAAPAGEVTVGQQKPRHAALAGVA